MGWRGGGLTSEETEVQLNQEGGDLGRLRRSRKDDDAPRQCLFTIRGPGGPRMCMASQAGDAQDLATTTSDTTLTGHYILKMAENTPSLCASKACI